MKKKARVLMIGAAAVIFLSGCSKFSPKETAVSIGKNGEITAAVIEKLDQNYYKEDELKSSIDGAVSEFGAANGSDLVSVEKYETEDRTVTLFMKYADADTYAKFNNVIFYAGDIAGAKEAGYDFAAAFRTVEKGEMAGKQVSGEEVLNNNEYNAVILEEPMSVEVPGNIVYVSSNVQVTGKKSAKFLDSASESETESEDTTEVMMLAPIEDMEKESTAKSAAAYIIYE